MREKIVEEYIRNHLVKKGWTVFDRMGRWGIDIEAIDKNGQKKIIEVKGCGAHSTAMSNNFQAVFGQILKDMKDTDAEYYIAFPHIQPYIRLWDSVPQLAKDRTGIQVIWVGKNGIVTGI